MNNEQLMEFERQVADVRNRQPKTMDEAMEQINTLTRLMLAYREVVMSQVALRLRKLRINKAA